MAANLLGFVLHSCCYDNPLVCGAGTIAKDNSKLKLPEENDQLGWK